MSLNPRGPDTFTKVTTQSYGEKIKVSFKGIAVGAVMFVAAFPVLFNNESRAVREANALADGRGAAVTVPVDQVNPANEGKLVHVSGRTQTSETLRDDLFHGTVQGLHLRRKVEFMQWKETAQSDTQDKLGGSSETTTTYTYTREWVDKPIDSSTFAQPAGHENTVRAKIDDQTWSARNVTLGAFKLTQDQIDDAGVFVPHPLPEDVFVPPYMGGSRGDTHTLYIGNGGMGNDAAIGDLRVTYEAALPGDVTVIARQYGDSFQPYQTRSGGSVSLLSNGTQSIDQMFTEAEARNATLTWIMRLVGLFMLGNGLAMILRPLAVFASVVPLLGKVVGAGTSVVAWALGLALGLITIAIAWLAARPMLGYSMLALAVVGAVIAFVKIRKAPAAAPAGQPA